MHARILLSTSAVHLFCDDHTHCNADTVTLASQLQSVEHHANAKLPSCDLILLSFPVYFTVC
jgi:hypothetical protein